MKKIIYVALLLMCAYPAFAEDIDASSFMNFNTSVIHDEAGNEWTAHGNPSLSSIESISGGKSLHIDGSSYLQAKDTSPFDFPGQFTMEAWIYPEAWVTDHYGGESFSIFSRWKHGIRTLYSVGISNGKLAFYSDFSGRALLVSKSSVPLDKWSHIAITRDANNVIHLFLNGRLEATASVERNFSSTDYVMTIGASSNAMRKSIGYIDDWHVYKTCKYTSNFTPSKHVTKSDTVSQEGYSAADEIRKFKGLLDDGIITQEEFDAKKKMLLGL